MIVEGYSDADNTVYLSQGAERVKTFSRVIRLIEERVPQKGHLLDVGCAGGFFVKVARDAGWDAWGIEPSRHSCAYAEKELGVQVKQGILRDRLFPESSFDVITMWDVLEHVGDPTADLLEARRLLKPGGWLLINFPDYSSMWAKLLKRRWWFLINVHIYYFTPSTLSRMLRQTKASASSDQFHFQTLKLGYLAERLKPYSSILSGGLSWLFKKTKWDTLPFTYYARQMNILCQNNGITPQRSK